MTPEALRDLRLRIDAARRVRVALEDLIEKERAGAGLCAFCGAPIPLERVGRGRWKAIYCQPSHRQYAYRRRKQEAVA